MNATSAGSEPILRPGIDFTSRGELKYARAVHLANELRGRVYEWSAAETLLAQVHRVDDHTIEFRAIVKRQPPIDEWSLILGDAMHNLRSAFDNVMWGLATLDGVEPKKPNLISFPVTKDERDWKDRTKNLESVPATYLNRIRQLQAWEEGIEPEQSGLWLLHQVDNIDKHRGLIAGAVHFQQLSLVGLELNLQPAATADQATPSISFQEQPVRIEDRTVVLTIHCDTHTIHPDPDFVAKIHIQFFLDWGDDRIVLLDAYLSEVLARTREWLDRIYGGDLYAKSLIHAREATGPTVTFGFVDENQAARFTHIKGPAFQQAPSQPPSS